MSLSNSWPKWDIFFIFGRFGSFWPYFGSDIFGPISGFAKNFDFGSNFSNFNELNLFDFFVGCYYYGGQQMFFSVQDNFMMTK